MKRLIFGIFALLFIVNFSGCSGSENAMPFSGDNIKELSQKIADSSNSMDSNIKQIDALKILYKDTLDDMGYSLDATILEYIKYSVGNNRTQWAGTLINIFGTIEQFIIEHPKLVVNEDIVEQDTVDKILHYHKYGNLSTDSIQAVKYVNTCQKQNSGICSVSQYLQILLDNKFIEDKQFSNLTVKNFWKDGYESVLGTVYESEFGTKAAGFSQYVVFTDGNKAHGFQLFMQKNKKIKLKENALKDLKEYNPWWRE